MSNYKYYTQEGNQYTLKVQKLFLIMLMIPLFGISLLMLLLFIKNSDSGNILPGLLFLGLALLLFFRINSKTIIDTVAKKIIVKQFSFSQPVTYDFKDYDGVNNMNVSTYGIKGTSTVGLRFLVNGKVKEVKLLQSFMGTKSLHNIIKETEEIMGL